MRKNIVIITLLLIIPMMMNGQDYSSLWKQVSEAVDQDLPKTEQKVLRQIAEKAEAEGNYAQLLKAELQEARSLCSVSPDSLAPSVERLKEREAQAKDSVLKAVYDAVLGYVYKNNSMLDEDNYMQIGEEYYTRALAHPDLLAATKTDAYVSIIEKGHDSPIFNDDMLNVIGYEARRFDILREYYTKSGNREAALLTSLQWLCQQRPAELEPLNSSPYLQRIDSLINEYGDLQAAAEAAIERYNFMKNYTEATAQQKMDYLDMAISRWGKWKRIAVLQNEQRDLTALQYNVVVDHNVTTPDTQQEARLYDLRGISEITMRIYKADVDGDEYWDPQRLDQYEKLKKKLTPMPELTQTHTYMVKNDYELYEDTMQVPALPVGIYMIETESKPETRTDRQMLYVSSVRILSQNLPERKVRIAVVDAVSGQPLKGAKVKVVSSTGYYSERKEYKLTTDDNGEAIYNRREEETSYDLYATVADDRACPPVDHRGRYSYYANSGVSSRTEVFTDRQIYRTGQTVYAAAIFYTLRNVIESKTDSAKEVTFQLQDANNKVVAEKKVTTDQYGTCTAQLLIPSTGLTGSFTVRANGYSKSIRVEEYKRPAFEVEIPAVRTSYQDGDTVAVKGTAKSYAGVPVQDAQVKYKVVRRTAFWWINYYSYWNQAYFGTGNEDEVLAEGMTVTNGKGEFTVDVPIVVPKTRHPMFYNFIVSTDVTDEAGETHQASYSLPMGNRPKAFTVDIDDKVLNERDETMTFSLKNAAGTDLDAPVSYRFDNSGEWKKTTTGESITLPKMKSGMHKVYAKCDGETLEREFIVFSLDDQRPAEETDDWWYVSHSQFPADGSPVTIQVGASDPDLHILCTFFAGNTLIESGIAKGSNELLNRKLTYKEEYGNGLLATFAWVKNGKVHTHSTTIRRPMPDKRLTMRWHTFRDRLLPGQQEEWTLNITTPDGQPADAQLMATLYDKSLDQLAKHSWNLDPTPWLSTPSTSWDYGTWDNMSFYGYKHEGYLRNGYLEFSHFNHELYPSRWVFRPIRLRGRRGLAKGMVYEEGIPEPMLEKTVDIAALENEAPLEKAMGRQTANAKAAVSDAAETEESVAEPEVVVRQNLSETAFFMPQLAADSTGNVTLRFTLPESLTTWRFLAVAHTRDMMYGNFSAEAVARKEVMIQPNMPRFLRKGDKATIAARVFNMSDNAISGTARLLLLDPETEQVVFEQAKDVSLPADSSTSVRFELTPLTSNRSPLSSILIARVTLTATAVGAGPDTPPSGGWGASDGEQHYLPILPDREHVTVTVPFTQHEPGTKEIDLTKLVPEGATEGKLTIEYTNSPEWLMVQALPAIGHPDDDCALCQAASFYANTIAQNIIAQVPKAKDIFQQWMDEEAQSSVHSIGVLADAPVTPPQPTTLSSQLEKNQELKDLLLNETPWVLDADNEREQRHRLADFFDQQLMEKRLDAALSKMKELQQPDGSWSWWPGMRGSWYMTVSISQMLARLDKLTAISSVHSTGVLADAPRLSPRASSMLDRAFKFMGNEAVDIVKEIKRMEKEYGIKPTFPNQTTLDWLYICTLDGRKLPAKVQAANDYLIALLKKEIKNQSIYGKAMTAIVLSKTDKKLSKRYVQSLKEYTVYREDMGRYYDTDRALYSWRDYRIPTQVAALEAMQSLTPDDTQTIIEMQRWLLQQKRTQAWDTPINSVDAVYAFLKGSSDTSVHFIGVLADAPLSSLSVDGDTIDTSGATAGVGYIKTAMPAEGKRTFTAEKSTNGTSWGAVYAQFLQPTSDITDQQSGIKVTREILTSLSGDQGASQSSLTPPSGGQGARVGDRITVRITIEADRDYDFVQVIDKRAACMEPVNQKSGYIWGRRSIGGGFYCSPRDCSTNFYFDCLSKGKHVIETEYFIDRPGTYETGVCTASCAYSPEFRGMTRSITLTVTP